MTESQKQERRVAKFVGGEVQPNSGGTLFGGGDVLTDEFFIECKTKEKPGQSISVKREWLNKASSQSYQQRRDRWAVAISYDTESDFYIISARQFKELVELIEGDKDGQG
jgi:hypothetical protein